MLKLIVGKKGTGKTKMLISMVNEAVDHSDGKIVCIEKGTKLTYDIHHGARLLDTDAYGIHGFDMFYGFLAGAAAGDFDVTDIFVDSIFKICGDDLNMLTAFLEKINQLSGLANVNFVFTISAAKEELPEEIHKYIV